MDEIRFKLVADGLIHIEDFPDAVAVVGPTDNFLKINT